MHLTGEKPGIYKVRRQMANWESIFIICHTMNYFLHDSKSSYKKKKKNQSKHGKKKKKLIEKDQRAKNIGRNDDPFLIIKKVKIK